VLEADTNRDVTPFLNATVTMPEGEDCPSDCEVDEDGDCECGNLTGFVNSRLMRDLFEGSELAAIRDYVEIFEYKIHEDFSFWIVIIMSLWLIVTLVLL